ncbi:hypothetical protein [Fretibacter rubidus]|uniref:hypothetical protein n=1 Tax=Fretibacter rubidus TaxID=570162 RepID=UPI00352AF53A
MTKLIKTVKQAEKNTKLLYGAIEEEDNQKKAKSLIANGRNFFAYRLGNEWIFAPSRFVGYKKNTIISHTNAVSSGKRDGKLTDKRLSKIAHVVEPISILYSGMETSFGIFCDKNSIKPSLHPRRRKFWVSTDDIEVVPVDEDASWENHSTKLAKTIIRTIKTSGKKKSVTSKLKKTNLSEKELIEIINQKLVEQNYLCKLTGLKMLKSGNTDFYPSADRIDSNEGYFTNNIQLVCRFANMWKGAQDNSDFLKLINRIKIS